jgi:AcrR family transcriptional regulator
MHGRAKPAWYRPAAMPTKKGAELSLEPGRMRRRRGEPRRLLIEAASDVFNEKGYAGASTREIADRAAVSETLMFRYFGSKAGLFREAMVVPFSEFVETFVASRTETGSGDPEELSRQFIGAMYDIFRTHRALAAMLFAADVHVESELASSGVLDEVRTQIEALVHLGEVEMRARGLKVAHPDLTTRATIAMIAGMATFGSWFFGKRRPARDTIVEELIQAVLYGRSRFAD